MNKMLIPLCICAVLYACKKEDAPIPYIYVDDEGVRHIHNTVPAWGSEPKLSLEFVQKIGELEPDDENYMFYMPKDVCKDNKGNIYIFDAGNSRIQKYDKNGKYIATVGRKGYGPGEFNGPIQFDMDMNGIIYVLNYNYSMLNILNSSGKEIKRFSLKVPPNELNRFRISGLEILVMGGYLATIINDKSKKEKVHIFKVCNFDGDVIHEFGTPDFYSEKNDIIVSGLACFDVDKNNNIYIANCRHNTIEKRTSDGKKIFFITDCPIDYEEPNPFGNTKNGPGNISMNIGIDSSGRIWVATYTNELIESENERRKEYKLRFDVFDSEGIWLGSVPVPVKYQFMRVLDKYIYFTVESISVLEYKIIEK